jgi:hypothetical protein
MTILLTGAEPNMVHAALDAGESVVVFNPAPVSIGRVGARLAIGDAGDQPLRCTRFADATADFGDRSRTARSRRAAARRSY